MRIIEIIKGNQETVYYRLNNKHRHRKKKEQKKKLRFEDYDKMMKYNRGIDERRC